MKNISQSQSKAIIINFTSNIHRETEFLFYFRFAFNQKNKKIQIIIKVTEKSVHIRIEYEKLKFKSKQINHENIIWEANFQTKSHFQGMAILINIKIYHCMCVHVQIYQISICSLLNNNVYIYT